MILIDLQDALRNILGAYRVQYLTLQSSCSSAEASALDFQFRNQLYEDFDYASFARQIMAAVPEETVIDYKDDFGLHYFVFEGISTEKGSFIFLGPYLYHPVQEEEYSRLISMHSLNEEALEAIRWYFKRIPVIHDYLSWQHMFSAFLSRYFANPDLEIISVSHNRPEAARQKPVVALSAIPYASVEARYAVEDAMLEAIRQGDFSEAIYQQNLFMGFSLDQRITDSLRDAKDMIIAVNTACRKAIQQAAVHPLYIDGISGQFVVEIEEAQNIQQVEALIPKMIRNYCMLVQQHSLARYSTVIRNCLNYIDFHYSEPLSLEILASRFSLNKNYLSSRFHRETGMTVTDYVNRIRTRHAEDLLGQSTLSVQEIAEQCGFSDGNYFTRIFKRIRGVTPNEYRKSVLSAHPLKAEPSPRPSRSRS